MVSQFNYCFKGRCSNVSACGFHVNGQYVEISKCAMYLGHSGDRAERSFFGVALIYFELILVIYPLDLKMYYNYAKYCCIFFGNALWSLKGVMIQLLCVGWRMALVYVWSVNTNLLRKLSNSKVKSGQQSRGITLACLRMRHTFSIFLYG